MYFYKGMFTKTLVWLLLISIVITMAASLSSETLWMQWSYFPMVIGFFYITSKCKLIQRLTLLCRPDVWR